MGTFPYQLGAELRDRLGTRRLVETGTYYGHTSQVLAGMFEQVVTVERSELFFERAQKVLGDLPNVQQVLGHSAQELQAIAPAGPAPTIYWLDAHCSGGETAGADDPQPINRELEALRGADPRDVILIDDARDFAAPPFGDSPELVDVIDKLREVRPGDHVTVMHDLIISVPQEAKDIIHAFGRRHLDEVIKAGQIGREVVTTRSRIADRVYPARAWVGRKLGR